jgi:hypothetical protein
MEQLFNEQRSVEWYAERLGKFTSSECVKLLKSGTRKMTANELVLRPSGEKRTTIDVPLGDGAMTYIYTKVAEIITGEIDDDARGDAIDWGIAHEPDAIDMYQFVKKLKVIRNGFEKYNDFFGGSPDGKIGEENNNLENGIIEVKCPKTKSNHIKYFMIQTEEQFRLEYEDHYAQIQGNLLATGRGWCDFISFDPRPKVELFQIKILRIMRNDPFIEDLKMKIELASDKLTEILESMVNQISIYTAA